MGSPSGGPISFRGTSMKNRNSYPAKKADITPEPKSQTPKYRALINGIQGTDGEPVHVGQIIELSSGDIDLFLKCGYVEKV